MFTQNVSIKAIEKESIKPFTEQTELAVDAILERYFYSQFWNENGWYRMRSQHSVHSAPGSRMDEMSFCPFRNMNAE